MTGTETLQNPVASMRGQVIAETTQWFEFFARDASLGDVLILRDILRDHNSGALGEQIILPNLFAEALGKLPAEGIKASVRL